MAFIDRFMEVPIEIFDVRQQDLTGDAPLEKVISKILPMEISEYYGYTWNEGELRTSLYMKNGRSFSVLLSQKEFERRVNERMQ